ncbi:MAG: hypothetical protein WKF30_00985 [Pyrinomonadaceae bacterium]
MAGVRVPLVIVSSLFDLRNVILDDAVAPDEHRTVGVDLVEARPDGPESWTTIRSTTPGRAASDFSIHLMPGSSISEPCDGGLNGFNNMLVRTINAHQEPHDLTLSPPLSEGNSYFRAPAGASVTSSCCAHQTVPFHYDLSFKIHSMPFCSAFRFVALVFIHENIGDFFCAMSRRSRSTLIIAVAESDVRSSL